MSQVTIDTGVRKIGTFNDLLGETIQSIEFMDDSRFNHDSNALVFNLASGRSFKMYHQGKCCEEVYLEDINGNLHDLIGNPLLMAEEVINKDKDPENVKSSPSYDASFTWTFYKLATIKGMVTLRWFGSSNGYYSETVDFAEVNNDPKHLVRERELQQEIAEWKTRTREYMDRAVDAESRVKTIKNLKPELERAILELAEQYDKTFVDDATLRRFSKNVVLMYKKIMGW